MVFAVHLSEVKLYTGARQLILAFPQEGNRKSEVVVSEC